MLSLILIVPGLVVGYALLLRPILHKVPVLAAFYAEADGFWAKVWASCGKSATVAWGYALGGLGSAMALLDPLANAVGAGPEGPGHYGAPVEPKDPRLSHNRDFGYHDRGPVALDREGRLTCRRSSTRSSSPA